MYRYKRIILAACLAAAVGLSACGSADSSEAASKSAVPAAAEGSAPASESESAAATTEFTEAPPVTAPATTVSELIPSEDKWEIDAYGQKLFKFTDEYNSFLEGVVFIGDSVCSGLKVYHYLPDDQVLAEGSVAARNIFDFEFDLNGGLYGILDAVKIADPKVLICSMGINDVNLTTQEQFCENYIGLLDKLHEAVPNAKLYVASITPTAADCEKILNTKVQDYNAAIEKALSECGKDYGFLEIGKYLKNDYNALSAEYSGSDGIHLQAHAYSAILYQVCEQILGPAV